MRPPPPTAGRGLRSIFYICYIIYILHIFYKSSMTMYLTFVPKHKYQCFGTLIKVKVISDHQVIKVKQIGKPKMGYRDAIPTWFEAQLS